MSPGAASPYRQEQACEQLNYLFPCNEAQPRFQARQGAVPPQRFDLPVLLFNAAAELCSRSL